VTVTAPGHLKVVLQYAFDPLSKSQTRQLRDIASRCGTRSIPTTTACRRA
jgi:hypothetical protein